MERINLNGKWKGHNATIGSFTGTVPGCVHTDLIKAGRLYQEPVPAEAYSKEQGIFFGKNAEKTQWIEQEDFTYEKTFTVKPGPDGRLEEGAFLVFECLDTYASVWLNGTLLGRTEDMHIAYRFPVDGILKPGKNVLRVEFVSPIKTVAGLPKRHAAFTSERVYTRRIQCTYGWDWVYRFVTCGIERDCYIVFDKRFRAENVYVYTTSANQQEAAVQALVKVKNFERTGYVTLEVLSPSKEVLFKKRRYVAEAYFTEYIDVIHPELWFPSGYGKQPLYTIRITSEEADGTGLKVLENKFGIRTVRILQIPDPKDSSAYRLCRALQETPSGKEWDQNETFSSFIVAINGRKIFVRGGNWVPCDPFITEESDGKITRLLTLAKDAGLNMVRVWGGGIFEKDHFYNECDRLGVMVTQDFLMACGNYPEEDPHFLELVSEEARQACVRLRNHPSLVWWSGDNENAVKGYEELEKFDGRDVALKAIAPVLRALDYNRHFLPSSPYGGKKYASKTKGTTHNTNFVRDMFQYMLGDDVSDYKEHYKEYLARFIAEEPSMGAVSPVSLREFMTEEDIYGNDDMWNFHTQSNPKLPETIFGYTQAFSGKLFGTFTDGADRLFKNRFVQCEWVRVSSELVRRHLFFASGIVYWMLNDCWPASSGWAFLDYYTRPKDAYYAFKRNNASLTASLDREGEALRVYLSNTGKTVRNLKCTLYQFDLKTGELENSTDFEAACQGNTAAAVHEETVPQNRYFTVLDVRNPHGKLLFRTYYRDGGLPIRKTDAYSVTGRDEHSVTVRADTLIVSVFLDADLLFEDNCFMMLPGEERRIGFKNGISYGRDHSEPSSDICVTCYGPA